MNRTSLIYKKGDLVSIKQDTMILYWDHGDRMFSRAKKVHNGIFMGIAKDDVDSEVYDYCVNFTPIRNPCKVAIGDRMCYVDETSFYFYTKRRNYEKINRSYAE